MHYEPLTPKIRKEINQSINQKDAELNACDQTAYVSMYRLALQSARMLINALPDGYPMPIEKRD